MRHDDASLKRTPGEPDVLLVGGLLFLSGVVAMHVFSLWKPHQEEARP